MVRRAIAIAPTRWLGVVVGFDRDVGFAPLVTAPLISERRCGLYAAPVRAGYCLRSLSTCRLGQRRDRCASRASVFRWAKSRDSHCAHAGDHRRRCNRRVEFKPTDWRWASANRHPNIIHAGRPIVLARCQKRNGAFAPGVCADPAHRGKVGSGQLGAKVRLHIG